MPLIVSPCFASDSRSIFFLRLRNCIALNNALMSAKIGSLKVHFKKTLNTKPSNRLVLSKELYKRERDRREIDI